MIVAAVLMVVGVAGAAETPEPPTIRLQLRNEAKVPDDVLEESRQEVGRIFARAGFEVMWTDAAPQFTVKIVADVLGYDRAASTGDGRGVTQRRVARSPRCSSGRSRFLHGSTALTSARCWGTSSPTKWVTCCCQQIYIRARG